MIQAYILLNSNSPGKIESAKGLLKQVREVKGVKQAHGLYGPDGGIAFVEAQDLEQLMLTASALLDIEGIDGTDTRIAWPR